MEEGKKFEVEFKQTVKGSWYVGSLKVGADSVEELDKRIDSTVTFLHDFLKVIRSSNWGVENGK